jgi:hypothetical protein
MQVWEDGRNYKWNIVLDADIILRYDFIDPTLIIPPNCGGNAWITNAVANYRWNEILQKDGRKSGLGDAFIVTNFFTHDTWKPLDVPFEVSKEFLLKNERMISEYCLTMNAARNKFDFIQVVTDFETIFHPSVTTFNPEGVVDLFKNKLVEWGMQ